ncbi:MAG: hypothetical protein ABIR18_03235 [Chitinophagaceae bacterium]
MSSLKNKMNNYEVVPPANAWDKIAAALDESALGNEFPSRLYNTEVTPPAAVWNNITASLSESESGAPVVSMKRRVPSFVRYAVAAVLIGIVAFAVFKFTGNTPGTVKEDVSGLTTTKQTEDVSPKSNTSSAVENKSTEIAQQDIVPAENNNPIAQLEQPKIRDRRTINRSVSTASYQYADANDPMNSLYAYEDHSMPNVADRYIMLMTPEGNIIRMSKKWGNLVCCVSGEEQDADCKNQLKKWQQKLAASSTASPGNFLDIVNLVNSLEDGGTEL